MANIRQRLDLRIALIAALALLLAQLGAMTHGYSHVPQLSLASYAPEQPSSHEICEDCLNFAPLLSAADAPNVQLFREPPLSAPAPAPVSEALHDVKIRLAFRSRAPPHADL